MKQLTPNTAGLKRFTELVSFLASIEASVDPIWLRFYDWHLQHPDVEYMLVDLARHAMKHGMKRYGIGAIWEVLRWRLTIDAGKVEEFKCSNDYRSRYARFLMWKHDDLKGFFEVRPLHSYDGPTSYMGHCIKCCAGRKLNLLGVCAECAGGVG